MTLDEAVWRSLLIQKKVCRRVTPFSVLFMLSIGDTSQVCANWWTTSTNDWTFS